MIILGISAYYHDSAAALIKDERIIAAAQEERFTRVKHDDSFPINSIKYCLKEAGVWFDDINHIVFYDKPFIKFERLLETYLTEAPKGFGSFIMTMPIWLKEKLFLKETLAREFQFLYQELSVNRTNKVLKHFKTNILKKLLFGEHHQSHSASAFYPSPYEEAAILTIDGVGEWVTTSLAHGKGNDIEFIKEIYFPHSLGLFYSAFTYYTGFRVNSGEYKVMGLAPYGTPRFSKHIKENIIDIKEDGSFKLDMSYFNYTSGLSMTSKKFNQLFGGPPRKMESKLTQKDMDIAASVQHVTEEIIIKLSTHARRVTGSQNLCLAGGVALNCVANGKILKSNIFDRIWIQPAAGDAGAALGCAYSAYYKELNNKRCIPPKNTDKMQGTFIGPKFSDKEIKTYLDSAKAIYEHIDNEDRLVDIVSTELSNQKIIGWHYGKMEFGPRALGHRSIIGDPRNERMQAVVNLKVKHRESFRPFAPSVLKERVSDWFELNMDSPYMLFVSSLKADKRYETAKETDKLFGIEKLNIPRSEIPAVTHIDYSSRVQTVHKETNSRYHKLISKFEDKTECPIILNTSFNVRGEPIVCTPEDSYTCFMRMEIDLLVIDNYILYKDQQPNYLRQGA